MSEISETTSGVVWQSSPPGSLYDHIRVASFSLGPDGRVDQWSNRAADLFGIPARHIRGRDPVEAFMPPELRDHGHRRVKEVLDGREWTGLVPFRIPAAPGSPGQGGAHGLAELYVMPSETGTGERAALCLVVDVRALRRIETDLAASQAIFGQSPFGFLLFGTDLTVKRANQRFAAVFGGAADDHHGRRVHDYLAKPEADRMTEALRRVLETGEPVTDLLITGAAPGARVRRHWSVNLYRVHSGSGRPIGVAGLGVDVTRRQSAAREAASARRNLALLNEAGARIGNSLDLEATARELLDVAVPGFCDLASVDLYQSLLTGDEAPPGRWGSSHDVGYGAGSAELRRVAFASAVSDTPLRTDEGHGPAGDGGGPVPIEVGAVHRYPFHSPGAGALRTGRVRTVPGGEGDLVHSTLAVPMTAHDTVVGLVQFSRAKGSEPFGDRDRALAVELAARAAVCIDNARLYRREHERALILQRSLLPPGDPEAAGLDIACRYLPGTDATEVGGDWFDVIELPGHRTALVIGDVMGRGVRAAAVMGQLRTAVRAYARLDLPPHEVLQLLDGLAAEIDASQIATCVYAVHDPNEGRLVYASAGHLPILVRDEDGTVRQADGATGPPLGTGGWLHSSGSIALPPGSTAVLYTDGLVERRREDIDEGVEALARALAGASGTPQVICGRLLRALGVTAEHDDDVAVLVVQHPARTGADAELFHNAALELLGGVEAAPRARAFASGVLSSWRFPVELRDLGVLATSELVANSLQHGTPPMRLRLRRTDRRLIIEVTDGDDHLPRRRRAETEDEAGRGISIIATIASSWGSRRTPGGGKAVWCEFALKE